MVTAHPDFSDFFRGLKNSALFARWSGGVVRPSLPRWISRTYRFTGIGSALAAGRWTVKSLMPTVYASTNPAPMAAELHDKAARYGWTPSDFRPQLEGSKITTIEETEIPCLHGL